MTARLSAANKIAPDLVATASLTIETRGEGFSDLVEHRMRPHRREVVLQFIGSRRKKG